jgi:hypothetical protein
MCERAEIGKWKKMLFPFSLSHTPHCHLFLVVMMCVCTYSDFYSTRCDKNDKCSAPRVRYIAFFVESFEINGKIDEIFGTHNKKIQNRFFEEMFGYPKYWNENTLQIVPK